MPAERIGHLEAKATGDVGDRRFFAYLQLHEFEALLLADLMALVKRHPNRQKEIADLTARLNRDFPTPEHVDRLRPPSYWIKDAVPEYVKTVDGPTTTSEIGLPALRQRCPHFGQWLNRLEGLAGVTAPPGSPAGTGRP